MVHHKWLVKIRRPLHEEATNELASSSGWCDWAMGTISDSGCQNPHQERCFLSWNPRMLKDCDFKECRAWVHRLCQDDWLE